MRSTPPLPFTYHVVRIRRKTVAIAVRGDRVEVRAPRHVPLAWIDEFVRTKTAWVEQYLAAEKQRYNETFQLTDGATITWFGNPVVLHIIVTTKNRVTLDHDRLLIHCRQTDTAYVQKVFRRWLLEQAAQHLVPMAAEVANRIGVDEKLKDVRFRFTRRSWGRCSTHGVVQYNPLILLAPMPVVRYLVVHEVCHLRHMNHSPAYWATVATACDDHAALRRWLRQHEHRFML